MIPEAAVEAAFLALYDSKYVGGATRLDVRRALEAALPHMLAGTVSTLEEQVWRLENTLVDECDYPALCAQREALTGAVEAIKELAK